MQKKKKKSSLNQWREYWGVGLVDNLDYPFVLSGNRLISKIDVSDIKPKYPAHTASELASSALRQGAKIVRKWDNMWGIAVGTSLPGTVTAWFVMDDFEFGRFASLGMKIIENIAFGEKVKIIKNDIDQAATYALAHGISKKTEKFIREILRIDPPFPFRHKDIKRMWGGVTASLEDTSTSEALTYLQSINEINPLTLQQTTKTIEIVYERYTETSD